ncbi:VOC family protein [Methylopila turkensis]|uniref:VOC family protein n=1 Tax=Methylopila turkensis TaxID=1437816 RepID=A0A9W6N6E2_9HYPH|nr:VOC family protein [Methylopila turkensis]GLK79212.1 VOC family protein [Methylopila turkensis]
MTIKPYLFFDSRCEEAIAFYEQALGAERLMFLRYGDAPDPVPESMLPKIGAGGVLHATLKIGDGELMMSDGCGPECEAFRGFSVSLSAAGADEARRFYDALAEGGQIQMPLGPTFFSPCFGMVTDRFGVPWMVVVPGAA